jgi:uncharacterized protein YegJ (DUF2314 family)
MNACRFFVLTGVAASLLAGCSGDRDSGGTVKRPGQPPVTHVEDDDPKMLAAIDQARATADDFIRALNAPRTSQSDFSVKLPIKDGEEVEHMWITPVRHLNGRFVGAINNEPVSVRTVKMGDEVQVAKDEISDCMYIDDGKLVGGFTLRVLRDNLPENERQEFDRTVPFTVD